MARKKFGSDRFRFGADGGDRPVVYRPNELLVRFPAARQPEEILLKIQRLIVVPNGRLNPNPETEVDPEAEVNSEIVRRQRSIDGEWSVVKIHASAEPVEVASALRNSSDPVDAQLNHVYFVGSVGAAATVNPNYVAPNYVAPNYVAPNYVAPNYVAPNYVAPNYVAPNYMAAGLHGGVCGCGACPEAPDAERVIPTITARKAWGPTPGPGPTTLPAGLGLDIQIHVLDVRSQTVDAPVDEATRRPELDGARPQAAAVDPAGRKAAVGTYLGELADDVKEKGALLPDALFLADAAADADPDFDDILTQYLEEPTSVGLGANVNADNYVDPATNHSKFIEGVIDRVIECPGDEKLVFHHPVAGTLGDVEDADLVKALDHIRETYSAEGKVRIMNLSLSGYNEDDKPKGILKHAVRKLQDSGWLIVASAGNGASCRLAWPAALPGVVAVGAYGPCGPANFSNYGPWVDACAPGVDIVSTFPAVKKAGLEVTGDLSAASFDSDYASWSGTSFSAPFVAAKLAVRIFLLNSSDGGGAVPDTAAMLALYKRAIDEVILHPDAVRIPNYGTVVSLENIRVNVTREFDA